MNAESLRPPRARPVIVCTDRRYVCFGWAEDTSGDRVILFDARCAIRWGTTDGLHQLANTGPTKNSKIGAVALAIDLRGVTAVLEVTAGATQAWERA